jgi:hypothetical protein
LKIVTRITETLYAIPAAYIKLKILKVLSYVLIIRKVYGTGLTLPLSKRGF